MSNNDNVKMLKAFVLFYCVSVVMVQSESERGKREYEHRQPKLFSFNVVDEDVTIDLQFAIPFLKIPVKKTMDSAYGILGLPSININPASLALGGAVVLGTTVILPFFAKQYAHSHEDFRYAKPEVTQGYQISAQSVHGNRRSYRHLPTPRQTSSIVPST